VPFLIAAFVAVVLAAATPANWRRGESVVFIAGEPIGRWRCAGTCACAPAYRERAPRTA
jgi:hypothetical protein